MKVFSDGSEQVHVVRTFVPDDPRLPIEKGAATNFISPDGTERVVGKPLQIIARNGGVRILDAGWVEFGEETLIRGAHTHHSASTSLRIIAPRTNFQRRSS